MITRGIFHEGSGLGNQLHRYVATRCFALDKGEEWGMVAPKFFKGQDFMNLDFSHSMSDYHIEYPAGKVIPHSLENTIDGEFQNESIWENYIDQVREWLKVEPMDLPDDWCVINFRGGEYVGVPDLFLPQAYWDKAIEMMREINPDMKFEVHTDDKETAQKFFPDFPIIQDMEINWRAIRHAKYLILSNSSFAILPACLNEDVKKVIAPLHWAGYNKGTWQTEDNIYKKFEYIHHEN